ncbi:MAG: hypothetical protein D6731_18065 [Planctomycetota bacterium]|nr:MAG: hypothetical protein D6731_18065 [Planctomycetota bacterium]
MLVLAFAGYGVYAYRAMLSPAPLEFSPFRYRPLERSLLTAKFEFLELPSRLLTGGDAPVELVLNERELNALLFGDAGHSEATEKARVLIQPGDRLLFEYSRPAEEGASPRYLNVRALLGVALGPGVARIELHEASIGSYSLGPFARSLVARRLQEAFAEQYRKDARLRRVRALSIESGRVRLTYQPEGG